MKAVIYRDYGTAAELKVTEMPIGKPAKGEILIRNYAAGINPIDARLRSGEMKMMLPGGFPRIPGFDVAGVVETVNGTGEFEAGDRVMAFLHNLYGGAYAEYSICKSSSVVKIPDTMTFEDAAALPLAGSTAIQSLREHGKLEPDDRVLVIGATGGVGAFAVQTAKAYGCSVDGVAAGMHESFAHEIGVEQFINYEQENYSQQDREWDLIFDAAGKSSFQEAKSVLSSDGRFVTTEPSLNGVLENLLTLPRKQQAKVMMARSRDEDLTELVHLYEAGKLKVHIEKTFPLEHASDAHHMLEQEHFCGKIVLTISDHR